jgi:polysaccharide biosynthesis transport protein
MNPEKALERITPRDSARLPLVALPTQMSLAESEPAEAPVPLSHYFWIVRRHKWRIAAFVSVSVLATVFVSSRLTPVYEATATIDIDRQGPTGAIGQDALRTNANDSDQFLATQIKLIQSDSVLRPVVRRLSLLEREPDAVEKLEGSAPEAKEAPLMLKRLRVGRPANTYLLLVSYRSADPHLAADVANGVSQSYVDHTYDIRYRSSAGLSAFMEKQLEELKAKMERSGEALMRYERELNVINPEERTTIVSSRLMQLNTEYTNAQADRVRKEAAYNSTRNGPLEAAQVSTQGDALKRLNERLDEANQKFVEVKTHFGANHPEYRRAAEQVNEVQRQIEAALQNISHRVEIEYQQAVNRERMLEKAVSSQKAEFDRVNAHSFEYQSLKQEAEADKKLYEELVRRIKEAGINASFQNSSIRIADAARPPARPVSPNVKLNAFLALMLSSVLAFGAAIISDLVDDTIRDPEQVQRALNAQVIATLPCVKTWRTSLPLVNSTPEDSLALVVAKPGGEEMLSSYAEAIRTLRNSLLLSDLDRRMRSILVTSASTGEGKSTAAAHLAVAHAQQGQRTLLIDGDLRRPSIAKRFGLEAGTGLSNVLTGELEWRDALVKLETVPDLDILTAGPPSRRAADLIGRGLFELLEEATREYDLVVLDGPPLPGFAEPLQMASAVDGVIVITRAGETSRKAVGTVLSTLRRLHVNVVGLVLNQVKDDMSQSYYYYSSYHKYYHAESRS